MKFLTIALQAITVIILTLALGGCSTIRMKYQAEVKPTAKVTSTQVFTHEQSYDVGGANKELCIITGIFLGGYCWFYTVMPTMQQKDWILKDANRQLSKSFPAGYEVSNVVIDRESWSDSQPQTELKVVAE